VDDVTTAEVPLSDTPQIRDEKIVHRHADPIGDAAVLLTWLRRR